MIQGFYLLAMQRARRRQRIAAAACLVALLFLVFAVRTWFTPAPVMAEAAVLPYTAVSENDRLVVYRAGEPVIRTTIDTRTLPEADRDALLQGVSLPDAEALAKLLEDYGS